ncbi:uncharacterized protein si:dkey-229b18.3 isoform X2 [Anguilla anguilla]|uniref:uncharacterized protein si:dkey-229b18.3 isoform X2 n=1 Tax=Anguilla anguilla TaxID=7936 RepID=UPI0015AB402D|nr:uncharacterized protein si:dkey-229b18.3 isoform X2 [Anguilla anguilla]
MAGDCIYNAHYANDDTFGDKHLLGRKQELAQDLRVLDVMQGSASTSVVASSPYFEIINGVLYRKKLEKDNTNYREVLDKDRRLNAIATYHLKGKRHHTLDDTYRFVAEKYWWEGMYFHIREYVLGCQQCQAQKERFKARPEPRVSRTFASHGNSVLHKLRGQQEVGLFCDITLKTGSRSFPAHRAVLAAVSEYFQEIFTEMDSAPGLQADIDLTGFSEELFVPLLEFSYSSTLSVRAESLGEVSALARHFGMWGAVEACSALQREHNAGRGRARAAATYLRPRATSLELTNGLQERCSGGAGSHKKRKWGRSFVQAEETSQKRPLPQDHVLTASDNPPESLSPGGPFTRSRLGLNGLSPAHIHHGPAHRLKLMDFKSPSSKPKGSPAFRAQSSSPAVGALRQPARVLRSNTGPQELLPRGVGSLSNPAPSSSKQRLSMAEAGLGLGLGLGRGLGSGVSVVKEEQVEEEVASPSVQEKYRLLSVLGLQRKSLLPDPVQPAGWQRKQRLRKLKVLSYALTAPRPSRPAPPTHFPGDSRNTSVLLAIKAEPPEPVAVEEAGLRRREGCGKSLTNRALPPQRRELRRSVRIRDAPLQGLPRLRTRKVEPASRELRRKPVRVKREPTVSVISPHALTTCSTPGCPREHSLSHRARCPLDPLLLGVGRRAASGARLVSQTVRDCTSQARVDGCAPWWQEAIKDEPLDPVPVTTPVAGTTELGKRRSKPPMKLLDPGFLFEFCRPPRLKREAESVAICLTRSVNQLQPRGGASGPRRKERGMAYVGTSHRPNPAGSGTAKDRGNLPKKRCKRLPRLESTRRARWKARVPVTSHTCVQCRAKYRNCDSLIMHQIRHIEGKHWPCPLCSKTFFRQRNVQSHIRTHDQKLYKCRVCISAA